jgi:hypothetical protein
MHNKISKLKQAAMGERHLPFPGHLSTVDDHTLAMLETMPALDK